MDKDNPKDARSGINPENIQEVIDASISAKHATLGGQQQYQTPAEMAVFFNSLLPKFPDSGAFDPQCAAGNTITCGMPHWTKRYGFEIDNRYRDKGDGVNRLIINCVKAWEIMDDVFPELRMECQNANPPFGCIWPLPDGTKADSTEYTWRKITQRAHQHGYGWFISNKKTIERLGIEKHEWVYLYQTFPMGVWKNCEVEIGVVHWDAHPGRLKPPVRLDYLTLDLREHKSHVDKIVKFYYNAYQYHSDHYIDRDAPDRHELGDAFLNLGEIVKEEHDKKPPFNIYLDKRGMLKTYLSTRFTLKRKLSREEILRVAQVNDEHPLTLTTDRESRKLLADLVGCGIYTIEPAAEKAIRDALVEVNRLAAPIMPVTDFETVAYADEEDHLVCREDWFDGSRRLFTKGKSYEIQTASYSFTEEFERNKPHYSEEDEQMRTVKHRW